MQIKREIKLRYEAGVNNALVERAVAAICLTSSLNFHSNAGVND